MRRARGFTLVELVMVIVILAIVATISVQFVSLSTRGALDVSARQQRALQGVVISEQLSRQLREAFPLSIRVSGQCLEWLPVLAATNYIHRPQGPGFDKIDIVPFSQVPAVGNRALIYGYGATTSELYGTANPGPVSTPIAGIAGGTITLSSAHRFRQQSPVRRLYVIGSPVSVCQNGRMLYRYSGYGRATSQPSPPTGGVREVMSANLSGPVDFRFTPPTYQRAAVVEFALTLKDFDTGSDETTTTRQEVQIRNVP
ncbi:type II secretion system protein J [Marinobacter koreensis]|uniref:Type II secretion system protein J n=1 Tax=Marinobacter koreensis TaxID=335974 RepID=A0ABW0RLJ0_9GAMM|nr:type II secretion system protein [Marinobacter koreensis]MCK7549757.1 type II secretion system GspH family protein [Marinobacter koreensis]